jgi:hypothetical protein
MIVWRSGVRWAAVLGIAALGCGSDSTTTPTKQIGTAALTVEWRDGRRVMSAGNATFFVYSPGPTPASRAMILTLESREHVFSAPNVKFYQQLPDSAGVGVEGSFGVASSLPANTGDLLGQAWLWTKPDQQRATDVYMATGRIALDTATADRVAGSFRMTVTYIDSAGPQPVDISATFTAERVPPQ